MLLYSAASESRLKLQPGSAFISRPPSLMTSRAIEIGCVRRASNDVSQSGLHTAASGSDRWIDVNEMCVRSRNAGAKPVHILTSTNIRRLQTALKNNFLAKTREFHENSI